MASFWDDLGSIGIGALTGGLTGGFGGALAGGLGSALSNKGKPLTLGSALQTGLQGAGAGALARGIAGRLPRRATQGPAQGAVQPAQDPDFAQFPEYNRTGLGDRAINAIGNAGRGALDALGGIFRPGTPQDQTWSEFPEYNRPQQQGFGDRALGWLSRAGQGASGALDRLGGVFSRGQRGGAIGTPDNPEVLPPGGGVMAPGWGGQSGGGGFDWQNAAKIGGLGLGAYALLNPPENPSLTGALEGAEGQTQGMIDAQVARQNALRKAAEEQFISERASTRGGLESVLGQGTDQALQEAIRRREQTLNAQGLLGGPSGALNEALAQEAGRIRREQLPTLLNFDTGTSERLAAMRGGGLDAQLGLENAGLERQFGLGDTRRSLSLREKLLEAERNRRKQQAMLGAAGGALGYGFGGLEGAEAGVNAGRRLEDILS